MNKRLMGIILGSIMILTLAGCGKKIDYSLPDDPIAFETGTFVNPNNEEDAYMSVEYNGRTYIGYGTLKGIIGTTELLL